MEKLLLIDGNSIINRAFYGTMNSKLLMTEDGTYTNAIYGFLSILFKIQDDLKPDYIAVAFDLKAPTFRHKMYTEYKGTRKGMPNELASQMPILKDILKAMNIKIVEEEGFEADDILGTLAKSGEKEKLDVTILTGDRDAFQLASNYITIRIPRTKAGVTETENFNEAKVIETYGLIPEKLIEVKALAGDASDNIPGVSGVGEKTAINLVKEYGSVDEIYNNIEKQKGKLKENLEQNKELCYLSKELGKINIDVPIDKDFSKYKLSSWNNEEVISIFEKLKFSRFLSRFDLKKRSRKQSREN